MLLTEGVSVELEGYNDALYKEEEIMVPLDKIRDPLFTLRYVGDSHECNLFNSMHRFGYHYARGLMTCTFVSDGNADDFNMTNITNKSEKPAMLNPELHVFIIDGRHRHTAIFKISDELNGDLQGSS